MINKLLEFLNNATNIAIITHKNPDGDALGSALMMYEFINTYFKNKKKSVFTDYVTLSDEFKVITKEVVLNPKERDFDGVICVDVGDKQLLGKFESLFDSVTNSICIDHHKSNTYFCKTNIVDCLSSNCEHLYNLLKSTGLEITKEMGKYACVGIMTDTNALSTNSVDAGTYRTVGELADLGVDVYGVRKLFFSGNNLQKYKLVAKAMSKAEFLLDNKVMFINLTKQDFEECELEENDTVGIINQAYNMKDAYACFMVTPRKGVKHVSMRCVEGIDVSKIAESFGGGGHMCAAASNTDLSIDQIRNEILKQMQEQISNFKTLKTNF